MAEYHTLLHPRKISEITDGEIALYASSDGGTTFYPVKLSADGGLLAGGISKTIVTTPINISSSGDNAIVAADANNKIHVVKIILVLSAENDITFKRASTALSGAMPFAGTNEVRGATLEFWPHPMSTALNEAFIINLSNATLVAGVLQYYKEA